MADEQENKNLDFIVSSSDLDNFEEPLDSHTQDTYTPNTKQKSSFFTDSKFGWLLATEEEEEEEEPPLLLVTKNLLDLFFYYL